MKTEIKYTMSKQLVTIGWKETLLQGFTKMRRHEIRHLPVLNDSGQVVGIITDRDFQRAMQVDVADFLSDRVAVAEFDPSAVIRDFMSWPVKTVDEGVTLGEVARRMMSEKVSAFLVTRETQVVGIVTTDDMLKALVSLLEEPGSEMKASLEALAYNSPIGRVVSLMSDVGI